MAHTTMDKMQNTLYDGRYALIELVGKGTSAKVYRATDTLENKEVAIKIFDEAYLQDSEAKRQFDHEIKAFAILDSHPNIVSYYGGSIREGCRYIVMELALGETLAHYLNLKGGKLPYEEALSYFSQILSALSYAHSKGIVHRDVKPQNVRLVKNGIVKLVDYGIALIPGFENHTSGKAVGTVNYISPEQATGGQIDGRSDLYSAGIMLYEMLTGHLPFGSEKKNAYDRMDEIIRKHLKETPARPGLLNPNIPLGLEQIVLRSISKNPNKRFDNAKEMLRYIKLFLENPAVVFHFDLPKDPFNAYDALPDETDANRFIPSTLKLVGQVKDHGTVLDKSSDTKKNKTNGTTLFLIASVFTLLSVLILVSVFAINRLFFYNAPNSTVITPGGLVNEPFSSELVSKLEAQGFVLDVQYAYNENIPLNTIISQEPAAQSMQTVPNGDKPKLILTVSGGCRVIRMPDYTDKEYRAILLELAEMGFEENDEVVVVKQYSDIVAEGHIIATEPAANEVAMQNSQVILYVSMGKETIYRYVPNLVGLSVEEAMESLAKSGISVGKVTHEDSDAPVGQVIAQSRPYGEKIAVDYYAVELTVSRGNILS